jgi:trigger factor
MKTEVKKIDANKRELNIEISGDIVKNKFEEVFKQIAQHAKAPGFRPGHLPRDILEKHYSSTVHEQVLKELLPEVYHQAVQKEGLDVIELPQISDVKLDRMKLSFKATVEVSPQIAIKDYKGIKVVYKQITVTEDVLKRQLDALKESRKLEALDDNLAKSLGYPGLAELQEALKAQIFIQEENQQRQKIENEIMENLAKDLDFKLPESMVNRQLQDLVRHAKVDLAMKGLPRDKIEEKENELTKNLEPEAKRQVKVYLILATIAKKENIPIDDSMPSRVMELLLKEANWIEST